MKVISITNISLFITFFFWVASTSELKAQNNQIREGHSGEARAYSGKNDALVLHIYGGTDEKYTAKEYAEMLWIMFGDTTYAGNFPTQITLFYEESKDVPLTTVFSFSDGWKYDKDGGTYIDGDGVFHPYGLVEYIPKIAEDHARRVGVTPISNTE